MTIKSINTRFRAYQMDTAGSSFSYFADGKFVLIEARYCEANKPSIHREMEICGVNELSTLHITSWDQDHCSPTHLEEILISLKPRKVEFPGYKPHTESGKDSLKLIEKYKQNSSKPSTISVTPEYIDGLEAAINYGYKDVMYWPREIDANNANNNSTVKQFRSGSFNVLSLGDVESTNISSYLRRVRSIYSEADIMIMAHHGADNGFTTSSFIKHVSPSVAIATSNYGNQFDHPRQEIKDLLYKNNVRLFTTKTGDVIVKSTGSHTGEYEVINLKANSTEVSSRYTGSARKCQFLKNNQDTLRDRRTTHNRGPSR